MERLNITYDIWESILQCMPRKKITNYTNLCKYLFERYGDFSIINPLTAFKMCHDMKISCDISSDKCTICT